MDKIAIISGVYGNVKALKDVLSDIDSRGITDVVCLGNIVKEGTDNAECLRIISERCSVALAGDKEERITLLGDTDGYNLGDIEMVHGMDFSHQFYMSGRLVRLFNNNPYNSLNKTAYACRREEMFKPSIRTGNDYADVVIYSDDGGSFEETVDLKNAKIRTLIGVQNVSSSRSASNPEGCYADYMILEGKKDSHKIAPISYQRVKVLCLNTSCDLGHSKTIGTM